MISSPVSCGNPHPLNFSGASERSVSKDWLRPIKRDGKSYCAWCNRNELKTFRSKYCSPDCLETSSAYCYPQSNAQSFYFLLRRQQNRCADCRFDYGPTLTALKSEKLKNVKKRIQRKIDHLKDLPIEQALLAKKGIEGEIKKFNRTLQAEYKFDFQSPRKIRKHHRTLKDQREPEVDHLIPIGAGGSALGFENLQLLCYKCHKTKTSRDLTLIREHKKGLQLQSS